MMTERPGQHAFRQHTRQPVRPRWSAGARIATGERGVVSVLTALVLVAMLGTLALVVDIGYAFGQRRLAQNVADSGAVAGTKVLARQLVAGDQTDQQVLAALRDVARRNTGGFSGFLPDGTADDHFTGVYVDATRQSLGVTVGSLGAAPPPVGARGVRLAPRKSFPTFFGSVLGHTTLTTGAAAIATSRTVTGLHPGLYGPYVVWAGESKYLCGDGVSYGCNLLGQRVSYRCNNYEKCNVQTGGARWNVTSNDFKGYLHQDSGFLRVSETSPITVQTGNATGTGDEPIAAMADCYLRRALGCTVAMPVADWAATAGDNGKIELRIVGFVAVKLTNNPATLPNSQAWEGEVVPGTLSYGHGVVTSGAPPVTGLPSLQYVGLVG